jgi:aspartate/methionine/tyrosine aminotransferase
VPEGAFYVFTSLPAAATDAVRFAETVLDGAGVAVTPGSDFGGGVCAGMLRFAYTESMQRLLAAAARLQAFLAESA